MERGRARSEFSRGILARNPETNCWQNGRVFVQETRARLPFLRRQRFSVPSLRLFAQWPWTAPREWKLPSRGIGSRILEISQQRIGWIKWRRKGEIKTAERRFRAAAGRKSGELKRLGLFYPPRRRTSPFLLHALAAISKANYNTGSRVTRNGIGDPGKNSIVEGEGGDLAHRDHY